MTISPFVTLAGLVAFATPAAAQDAAYVAGSIGYIFPDSVGSSIGLNAQTNGGYSLIGAAGYNFRSIRVELEGSYRESSVDKARGFGLSVQGTGDVSALSAIANVYLDPSFQIGPLRPYIGGGAGISRFKANKVDAPGISGVDAISATEMGFAYQFMAGVGWQLSTHATVTTGYRYFATPGIETDVDSVGSVNIDGLGLHTLEAGIRLRF